MRSYRDLEKNSDNAFAM